MAGLSAQEELILLRKRARRRLVGAVVLVSIATGVLWKVVGRVPEQPMKPESVLVVGESASGAVSKAPGSERPAASVPVPVEASHPAATALPESLSTVTEPVPTTAKPESAVAPARKEASSASMRRASDASAARAKRKQESKAQTPVEAPAPKPHKKPDPAAILEGRADAADSASAAPASSGKMMIQLAALSDAAKVDALRGKLASVGVSAHFSKVQTSKGEATRVRVGPFASRAEADAALRKLSRAGVSGIIVSLHTQ